MRKKPRIMRLLLILFGLVAFYGSYAQGGDVFGKIVDSVSKKQMALTTVTIYKAEDTSIVAYRLSNEAGDFRVPGLPLNTGLRLVATHSGYLPFRIGFELTTARPSLNIGILQLEATTSSLEEVIVFSERPPVIYKNDTIEFNATAFKTLPTALVEDLLRKLPGIEIDREGNIRMNGRKVNRILVDGKRFFGSDPRMATRNLPSDVVDKVQVMDDKEEMALNNDGNMSSIGKVINLTLKKGVKKLLFGKVSAGAGSDERYEMGAILNSFRDTLQLSLLGFRNNINRSSFSVSDVVNLGGMDRSGLSSIAISTSGGREGFSLNGISFGGMSPGITTATGAGFNLNHNPSKKLSFFGQYFYGNTIASVEKQQNTQRKSEDTVYNLFSVSNAMINGNTHNASGGLNWQIDKGTDLFMEFGFNSTDNRSNVPLSVQSDNNKLGLLSSTDGFTRNYGLRQTYNHDISLTHKFSKKAGRNLSFSHSYSQTQNPADVTTENTNIFYIPTTSTTIFQQLRSTTAPASDLQLDIRYSDPITKALTLRINELITYKKYGRYISTFGMRSGSQTYDSVIAGLSNGLNREQTRWSNGITIGYKIKKVNLNFSPTFLLQWINNGFTNVGSSIITQRYRDLLLNFNVNTPKLNFSFSQDVTVPEINYLNPVPDNTNPLFVSFGNPSLLPTRRSDFYFSANLPNIRKHLSLYISANTSLYKDYVLTAVGLNNGGIQTTQPINVNNVVTSYVSWRLSRQFRSSHNNLINVEIGGNASLSKIPVIYNNNRFRSTIMTANLNSRLLFNWHDKFEFSARYEPGISRTNFERNFSGNTEIITQNLSGEVIVRSLKNIVLESNLAYRQLSAVPAGFPRDNIYWNMSVTFLMLKENRGQLKLAVFDILNSNNFVLNAISGNAIVDTRTNVLKRYALVTFSYSIRSKMRTPKEVGGRQNMFFF